MNKLILSTYRRVMGQSKHLYDTIQDQIYVPSEIINLQMVVFVFSVWFL
jgi:hypothetical protein